MKQMVRSGELTLPKGEIPHKDDRSEQVFHGFVARFGRLKLYIASAYQFDRAHLDYDGRSVFNKTAHSSPLNILNLFSHLFTHYFRQRGAVIDVLNIIC